MELKDLIIDLRGKYAWQQIFEINFSCVGYTDRQFDGRGTHRRTNVV